MKSPSNVDVCCSCWLRWCTYTGALMWNWCVHDYGDPAKDVRLGSSIKDVRIEGEGGLPNADATVNFYLLKAKICGDRGRAGGGVKNGQILWTFFYGCPLLYLCQYWVLRLERRKCKMWIHTVQFICQVCHSSRNFIIARNFILTRKLEQKLREKVLST